MVQITMSNRNLSSNHTKLTIDVLSGIYSLDSSEQVTKEQLSAIGFEHPLLTEASGAKDLCEHIYEYDDFDGLMNVGKFVYGILIQASNPLSVQFTIRPSLKFVNYKKEYRFAFSPHYKKKAKLTISVSQLNAIVSQIKGYSFQYQDTFFLNKVIVFNDLPSKVNADLLYEANEVVVEFCKKPDTVERYDIRYMNHLMGFGVFARQAIKKDEILVHYCGEKCVKQEERLAYVFTEDKDCLKVDIDARHYGNIARFINHADKMEDTVKFKKRCYANVGAYTYSIYGNNVVLYIAEREIAKGEQLLVNYGQYYFKNGLSHKISWTMRGKMIDSKGKRIKMDSLLLKDAFFKILSNCGVPLNSKLYLRPAMTFILSLSAFKLVEYIMHSMTI